MDGSSSGRFLVALLFRSLFFSVLLRRGLPASPDLMDMDGQMSFILFCGTGRVCLLTVSVYRRHEYHIWQKVLFFFFKIGQIVQTGLLCYLV